MAQSVPLETLRERYTQFYNAAAGVPPEIFLAPMSPGGWSARDTVAHLVGWNFEMVGAGQDLLAGRTPAYYAETSIDYRDMNAAFVATYAEQDKYDLLSDLSISMAQFEDFLFGLDPADLDADFGVTHYRGGPATIARLLDSLGRDYEHHAQEVREWLSANTSG